ncbi:MAG: P-type DNA transfer ATPase VirB11 [Pseudomonadota bacterium]
MTSNSENRGGTLLEYLRILTPFLEDNQNTEIIINQPGEVITENRHGWSFFKVPELTYQHLTMMAKLVATYSGQSLDSQNPILSATLPHGERIQIVIPPITLDGKISFTIRKPMMQSITLKNYEEQGAFLDCFENSEELLEEEIKLLEFKKQKHYLEFLKLAVLSRKNIIISGSTGSGKTTLMRSLMQEVPSEERLISIENVDELGLYNTHQNSVSLFYSAGGQGISSVNQQQLLESSLRMKPDRIFVAELIRGDEAFYYLRNVNSGHPGSIASLHANSAKLAIEQLVLLLKESSSGSTLSRQDIKQLLFMCVDIIIQVKNIKGRYAITEMYYDPEHKRQLMI